MVDGADGAVLERSARTDTVAKAAGDGRGPGRDSEASRCRPPVTSVTYVAQATQAGGAPPTGPSGAVDGQGAGVERLSADARNLAVTTGAGGESEHQQSRAGGRGGAERGVRVVESSGGLGGRRVGP